jgi:hypothetical protein
VEQLPAGTLIPAVLLPAPEVPVEQLRVELAPMETPAQVLTQVKAPRLIRARVEVLPEQEALLPGLEPCREAAVLLVAQV